MWRSEVTAQYHLAFDPPFKNEYVDWSNGAWSVYRITGDQIANRIVFSEIVPPDRGRAAYYKGGIIARHSWCGYLGMFDTLEKAMKAIEADKAK
jgi:hypothetical protein